MTRYVALIDGEKGAYGVSFPDLPGCVAMGETSEEALEAAGDALREFFADAAELGNAFPPPREVEELRGDGEVIQALAQGAALASVPLVRETGRPIKANLSIDEGVLSAIDAEAKRRRMTRSAFVEFLAKRGLDQIA